MRIDAHQHFWRYTSEEYAWIDDSMSCLRREFLPEHLDPELKRTGFDGSIGVQARQTPRIESMMTGIKDQTWIVGRPENN
jgi:L-fuconolactonase